MKVETLPEASSASDLTPSTILIVDSSPEDANALARLLRRPPGSSLKVMVAGTMLDGLREFRHLKPDCVLINHRLADGDGVELLRMLNEITTPLPAPVILFAATDSPRLAVRALKAGAMDFLSKSWIDAESLNRAIEGAMSRAKSTSVHIRQRLAAEDANRSLQNRLAALEESDTFNRLISGKAPVFIYLNDLSEDRWIYANQTMLAALGYPEGQLIGRGAGIWRNLVHPQDLAIYANQVKRMAEAADGERIECEYRLRRKDGSFLKLVFRESVFSRSESGTVRQVVGMAEEASEAANLLNALEKEKSNLDNQVKELQLVWDQNLFGLALAVGSKPKEVKLNPLLSEWLQLPGSSEVSSLARAFGFTLASSSFGKALNRGISSHRVERTIHRPDGSVLRLTETVHPLPDAEGQIAGFVAYFMPAREEAEPVAPIQTPDLTSQKQLEELQKKLDAAEQKAREFQSQLSLSEDVAERLQNLLDREAEPQNPSEQLEQSVARAKIAEDRLEELDTRWRETLALLLSSDANREKLTEDLKRLEAARQDATSTLESHKGESAEALAALRHELEDALSEFAQLQEQSTSAIAQLEESQARSIELEREIETLRGQNSVAEEDRLRNEEVRSELQRAQKALEEAALTAQVSESATQELILERQRIELELGESRSLTHSLKAELDQSLAEQDRLTAEELKLKAQIEAENRNRGDLEKARLDMESSLKRAMVEIADISSARRDLEADKDRLAGNVESLQADVKVLQDAVESAASREAESAVHLAELENEKLRLARQLELTEAAVAGITEKLNQAEAIATFQAEQHSTVAADWQQKLVESESRNDSLEEEVATTLSQLLSTRSELDSARSEAAQTQGGLKDLEEQLRGAQAKLHEREERWWRTYREAESRERERAEAIAAGDRLQQDLNRLQAQLSDAKRNEAELRTRLDEVLQEVSQQNDLHEQTLSDLREARESDSEIAQKLTKTRLEVEQLSEKLRVAEADLDRSNQNELETKARLDDLAMQSEIVQGELRLAQNDLRNARDTESARAQQLIAAENSISALTIEANRRDNELTNVNGELVRLQADRDEQQGLVASQSEQLSVLTARVQQIEAELIATRKERDEAVANLSATQGEIGERLSAAEAMVTEKSERVRSLEEQLSAANWMTLKLESDGKSFEKALKDTTQQLETARVSVLKLEKEHADLQSELREASALTEAAVKDLEDAHTKAEQQHNQVEELFASLTETRERKEALESKANNLESDLSTLQVREEKLATEIAEIRPGLEAALKREEELSRALDKTRQNETKALEAKAAGERERAAALEKLVEVSQELTKAQNEARVAEEKYLGLANSLNSIVFIANTLGMIEYDNGRWIDLTGISMEQARETSWKSVIHKDDYVAFLKAWTEGFRSSEAYRLNLRVRRQDGVHRWHTLDIRPDIENGRIRCWHGTLVEIHEQVTAREAAKQARLRYGALLDNTSESILFLSINGHVLGASKASLGLLRQGAEGVVGTPFWETPWWHKGEQPKLMDAVKEASAGERNELESIRVDRDRQNRAAKVHVVPVRDDNEQVAMLVAHFCDL